MRMHGYDRADLGLVPFAAAFCLEPSHCMPAEPTFANSLEQASLIARLRYESVAARTQGNNLAAPGSAIAGIAVAGGQCPLTWSRPGAEGALVHGHRIAETRLNLSMAA